LASFAAFDDFLGDFPVSCGDISFPEFIQEFLGPEVVGGGGVKDEHQVLSGQGSDGDTPLGVEAVAVETDEVGSDWFPLLCGDVKGGHFLNHFRGKFMDGGQGGGVGQG
jgi:hypothetical protein